MSDSSEFFNEIRGRVRPILSEEQYKQFSDILLQIQGEWRGVQIYICVDQHYRDNRRKKIREEYDRFMLGISQRYGIGLTRIRQELRGNPYLSKEEGEAGQEQDLWCE
jgi:hypothetical protein